MTEFAEGMDIVGKVIEGGEIDREGVGTGDIDLIGLKKLNIEGAVEKIKSLKKILGIQNAPPVKPNPAAGGAAVPVVVNGVTYAPVDASSSSVTNAATMPISPPTNYGAIL